MGLKHKLLEFWISALVWERRIAIRKRFEETFSQGASLVLLGSAVRVLLPWEGKQLGMTDAQTFFLRYPPHRNCHALVMCSELDNRTSDRFRLFKVI